MKAQILEILGGHLEDLERRRGDTWATPDVARRLDSIRAALAELLPEGDKAAFLKVVVQPGKASDGDIRLPDAIRYCRELMAFCRDAKIDPADSAKASQSHVRTENVDRLIPKTSDVFIVHGHDTANTLRLRNLLKERFNLNPVILSEKAGRGRSVIEKFEDEASSTSFALALLTPDDVIAQKGGDYPQARPNVIFELGWFYGRLGRQRVCILFKRGTSIHSDLHGILRVEFGESVDEAVLELERELRAASMI